MDIRTFCGIAITEAKIKAKQQGTEWSLATIEQAYPNSYQLFSEIVKQHNLSIRPVVDDEEKKRTYFILYDNTVHFLYTSGLVAPDKSADPTLITSMLLQSGLNASQYIDGRAFSQIFADFNTIEHMVVFNSPAHKEQVKKAKALRKKHAAYLEMGLDMDEQDKQSLKKAKSSPSLEYLFKPLSEKIEELHEYATHMLGKQKASKFIHSLMENQQSQNQLDGAAHVTSAFASLFPFEHNSNTPKFTMELDGVEQYAKTTLKREI